MGCAGVPMALLVQSDMATPVISDLGEPGADRGVSQARAARREDRRAGRERAGLRLDVAGMRTWARKDGDDYVINGSKTFITNGTRADFITLMLKTSPEAGHAGISIVTFPTDVKGFHVSKKLKKIGNWSSDTAELFFEDCRIPRALPAWARRAMGFRYLMQNFQSERLIALRPATSRARGSPRRGHRLRARPQRLRQAHHQARGVAAQDRRPRDEARGRRGAHLPRVRGLQPRALRDKEMSSSRPPSSSRWRRSSSAT
jgi:alkylation response protein AidB-like acyl-CoA dehydrogenase